MSAPAIKARDPAPVMIADRIPLSLSILVITFSRSVNTSLFKALSLSGRLTVIVKTLLSSEVSSVLNIWRNISSKVGQKKKPHQRCGLPKPSSIDRKSTRLNSSHSQISYAVFCLKKKKKKQQKNKSKKQNKKKKQSKNK